MKSNCLFFAIAVWMKKGGYIVIQKSKYLNSSHVMWTKDFKIFHDFIPEQIPLKYPWIQKIYFKGKIRSKRSQN